MKAINMPVIELLKIICRIITIASAAVKVFIEKDCLYPVNRMRIIR
jgi:hypothetical protein